MSLLTFLEHHEPKWNPKQMSTMLFKKRSEPQTFQWQSHKVTMWSDFANISSVFGWVLYMKENLWDSQLKVHWPVLQQSLHDVYVGGLFAPPRGWLQEGGSEDHTRGLC